MKIKMSHSLFNLIGFDKKLFDKIISHYPDAKNTYYSSNIADIQLYFNRHFSSLKIKFKKEIIFVDLNSNKFCNSSIDKNIFRIIRYLNECCMILDDCIFFHAGCVEINNVGVGIVGDKYSGKTTLINNILSTPVLENSIYISNDKIAIKFCNDTNIVFSSPISMGVRKDMNLSLDELIDIRSNYEKMQNYDSTNKLYYSVKHILEKYKVDYNYMSHIHFFIKPHYLPSSDFTVRELDLFEKKKFLKKQLLDYITDCPFTHDDCKSIKVKDELHDSLLNIPIYELTYGNNKDDQINNFIARKIYEYKL